MYLLPVSTSFLPSPLRSISVIACGIDQSDMIALAGTLVHVPAGTTHWFRFGKGGGEMVSMTSREGASRLFADLDREMSPEKPDLGKLIEVGRRHGLAVAAPPLRHVVDSA
jgi:hypothetical protein